jgi:hypothetical protein
MKRVLEPSEDFIPSTVSLNRVVLDVVLGRWEGKEGRYSDTPFGDQASTAMI